MKIEIIIDTAVDSKELLTEVLKCIASVEHPSSNLAMTGKVKEGKTKQLVTEEAKEQLSESKNAVRGVIKPEEEGIKPEEEGVKSEAVTLDSLRSELSKKVLQNRKAIKDKLTELGATSLSSLTENKYESFHTYLTSL